MSPYRSIIKWISPEEVRPVVNELFNQAQQVRNVKNQIYQSRNELDSSWTGGARNSALQKIDALISDFNNYANSLEGKAQQIATVTVWIEIKEWFQATTGTK